MGQLPAYYNYPLSKEYWVKGGWTNTRGYVDMPASPLYPFGYGLSYTNFQYSDLHISQVEMNNDGTTQVSVDVENTGKRAGVETVQLYIHQRFTPIATPVKQLRGFQRIALERGEKKTAKFTLGPEDLQLLDRGMRWVVVPGTFDILVGRSSEDVAARATVEVKAPAPNVQ